MDYLTALQSLINIFQTLVEDKVVLDKDIFKSQMTKWLPLCLVISSNASTFRGAKVELFFISLHLISTTIQLIVTDY